MTGGQGVFGGLNRTALLTFGVQCELLPEEGDPVPFRAIFDRNHTTVNPGVEVPISTTGPMLAVVLADLTFEPAQGQRVSVPGEGTFQIDDVQPDSEGMAVLPLYEAEA